MCKKANRKYLGISLSRKSLQKHRKAFVSAVAEQKRKGKRREKQKRRKYIQKDKFAVKQSESNWTINRELHGAQFDRQLTMTWVPLLRHLLKEHAGHRRDGGHHLY